MVETYGVPRYLSWFGDLALDLLAEGTDAQVVHLHCLTGYPDRGLSLRLPGAHVYGIDGSSHAVELARAKAAAMAGLWSDYRVAEGYPVPLPSGAFSHALSLRAPALVPERLRLEAEMARLLGPHGQALVATPLRGSFQEILDLLREYALKHEVSSVAVAVEAATLLLPTPDILCGELSDVGFEFVETTQRSCRLPFESGRELFEDPVVRVLVLPNLVRQLGLGDEVGPAFAYVRDAIDRYWSDGGFELTVEACCVSGRRGTATGR